MLHHRKLLRPDTWLTSHPRSAQTFERPFSRSQVAGDGKTCVGWRLLIQRIDLLCHLVWRDLALRYQGSLLGILWAPLPPLAQLLVLIFIFRQVVPLDIEAYPAFVFSALLPWTWFSNCLSSAGYHFINNRDLVRRANFEPAMIVIVNVLAHLLSVLLALPILFTVLLLYGRAMAPALAMVPLLLFIQALFTIGLALMVATLNVFYRDVAHVVALTLLLLFYLTPVFYQPPVAGEKFYFIYVANPLSSLIQGYRMIFYDGKAPDAAPLLLSAIISIAFCVLGSLVYRRRIHEVIDRI